MEIHEFNSAVNEVLSQAKGYFDSHARHTIEMTNGLPQLYTEVVKATVIKAYEFSASLHNSKDEYMFFTLPVLRGICEEFIVEKFLFEHFLDEKETIIALLQEYERLTSSIAQWNFFEKNRPSQIVYYESSFPLQVSETQKELRRLIKGKFPDINVRSVLPSVHFMSKQTGTFELYQYLYHATSTFVHFNPGNLLRMGWGKLPNVTFSTAHFNKYYRDFAQYYSLWLLVELCQWQTANGYLSNFEKGSINTFKDILSRAARCPEIVTFEEMNVGTLSKHLFYKSPAMTRDKTK